MTRILITGAGGMLGRDLQTALVGRPVTAATRAELDITDAEAATEAVAGHDVVVNCAAYTAVDAAESDEGAAHLINATGAENLARASARHGARLIQVPNIPSKSIATSKSGIHGRTTAPTILSATIKTVISNSQL